MLWCINEWLYPALLEAKQATISPYIIEWGGVKVLSVEKKGVGASAKRAGVKCSPHVLRHTAAVWMAVEGVPMEEIAQYLGHEDVRTTYRIYARFSPDYMQRAARALALQLWLCNKVRVACEERQQQCCRGQNSPEFQSAQ